MSGPAAMRLRAGLRTAARLVARDGAAFLPVFARLEAEAARLDGADGAMERARRMAGS